MGNVKKRVLTLTFEFEAGPVYSESDGKPLGGTDEGFARDIAKCAADFFPDLFVKAELDGEVIL